MGDLGVELRRYPEGGHGWRALMLWYTVRVYRCHPLSCLCAAVVVQGEPLFRPIQLRLAFGGKR